ncbi:MAG TPA: class I SAM-dependent methyltransferase [Caulobacterales bacterium]|nr:class I SAM-dependent methyltransferase [Vitreimonas sp.]HVY85336.1 class I SAM-dependent methyltransferase [Caulobacterales bacterium]
MPYRGLSEAEWSQMWLRQAEHNDVADLPRVASAERQRLLHGVSGEQPMRGALQFRRFVLDFIGAVGADARLVDFGCGWGRHVRVFLKDFAPHNMFGVDIDADNIALCRELLPDVNFLRCQEGAPLGIASGSVDLAISFSVFSHLSEASARFWLNELARITKPGGSIIVTSWGKALFDIVERIKRTGETSVPWEHNIARAFVNFDEIGPRYAAGEYIFGRHGNSGSLDPDLYGISLMPKQWVERNAPVTLRAFVDDPKVLPQAVFCMTPR